MSAKDWKTLEEAEREGFSLHPSRTKEQLIGMRPMIEAARSRSLAAGRLMEGRAGEALSILWNEAGTMWYHRMLLDFDMRRVDEQGRLLADGWLVLPAPAEMPGVGLPWRAGDHLDDVLARGAAMVTERARRALTTTESSGIEDKLATSVLNAGDLLVIESPEQLDAGTCDRLESAIKSSGTRALLLEGPAHRVDLDRAKEVLRELGYDVVPLIRWEDVRPWLLSTGCKIEERPERCELLIAQGDHVKDGWALLTMWPARESELIDNLGKMMGMSARAVRAAIEQHIAKHIAKLDYVKSALRTKFVGEPMLVTTASGGTVDLRDPLSIRAGMRFYSPHWRNHCTPNGVLTVVRPDRSGGWECAEGVHCDPTTAALFLGCNPQYASSVDFAEFGQAPPLPAR
jgi:hypothetical protein